ncbi:hypothetical protein E1B28_011700 [Marasmius oreades]|uniref:Uncharacterized protein n=1 Tax=Marasmius oreades TaxID=181124 RepID=A0A9P7RV82_9AGAR|nr:uncharacterized protein E1B28_011700 [Marasmius oreades]KAG7090083.1 hypothetical protein E1B28_011700 [Marasmius oreades]
MILSADENLPPPPPYEAQEKHGSSSRLLVYPPNLQARRVLQVDPLILSQSATAPFILFNLTALPLPNPQTRRRARWDSPFVKGYNKLLADVGIPQVPFLNFINVNFIDGLNLAIAVSPPLRVVDITGKAIGYVSLGNDLRDLPFYNLPPPKLDLPHTSSPKP